MRTLVVAAFCCTLASLACGGGSGPDRRTIVDSRDTEDPKSLDPALSTDVPTGRAVSYLFDGLVRLTPDARVTPGLATSWTISADGRVYTFALRHGVHFHDGSAFSARDVMHSFRRVLRDSSLKGARGWPLYPIDGAKDFADGKRNDVPGLSSPNDSTVVLTLAQPLAVFLKMLAMPVAAIVPARTPADFGEHPVGTGPWRFVEWRHDDYLRFARNADYWGGAPQADSLMARIIPEPSTAEAEFESGNVDILYVPEAESRDWEEDESRKPMLQSVPALALWYVGMNVTRGPLKDVRVRQAIEYAIDAKTIVERMLGGRGTLANGVIPPTLDGSDPKRARYPFDPSKAKQLLSDAGYPHGIDLELWVSQTAPFPRIAQTIQAYLAQAGIRVKIVQRDSPSVRAAARSGSTDLVLKTWYADYPDAEDFLYPLLHTDNKGVGGNVSFYSNPAFDALVTRARAEQNDTARAALYRQADSLEFSEAPIVYLWYYRELYAVQPWLTGFTVPTIFFGEPLTNVRLARTAH